MIVRFGGVDGGTPVSRSNFGRGYSWLLKKCTLLEITVRSGYFEVPRSDCFERRIVGWGRFELPGDVLTSLRATPVVRGSGLAVLGPAPLTADFLEEVSGRQSIRPLDRESGQGCVTISVTIMHDSPISPETAVDEFLEMKATEISDSTIQNLWYRLREFCRWSN